MAASDASGSGCHGRQVAIMQPYFFPYIGYFQLMAACDAFVFLDDAQYIKQGWVNRNRMLVNGAAEWITLPVLAADHRLPINRRAYQQGKPAAQLARRIEAAYRNAPFFSKTMPLVRELLAYDDDNVARFNIHALRRIAGLLEIPSALREASGIRDPGDLACEHMVIDLCHQLGATRYINPIAGAALYPVATFREAGLELAFLEPGIDEYRQGTSAWQERLSIIDVLMFNDLDTVRRMLGRASVVPATTPTGYHAGLPPITVNAMREDVFHLTSRFEKSIAKGGVTPVGIMWPNATDLAVRFETLLGAVDFSAYSPDRRLRLLDLGCGPGFLLDWLQENGLLDRVDYTGVDVTEVTMQHARQRWPAQRFELRDIRERPFTPDSFDFCIICGIFTARFENSYAAMERLAQDTLRAVWPAVTVGLSFNTMSKHVDWERDDLFHWPLDDMMAFCKKEMSRHVALHLDYGPWETSVVVRRSPVKAATATPQRWFGTD